MFKLKRIYEEAEKSDGFRVLVDRLWPRGVSKDSAQLDLWLKEVAPSASLRKWFSHDPKRWEEFEKKYRQELTDKDEYLQELISLEKKHKTVTLLYSAKNTKQNQAVLLAKILQH